MIFEIDKEPRMSFSIDHMKQRNEALNRAGDGITRAREALDQLEHIILATAHGSFPDIEQVVELTSALQRAHDDILVGIVESSVAPTLHEEPEPLPGFAKKTFGHGF